VEGGGGRVEELSNDLSGSGDWACESLIAMGWTESIGIRVSVNLREGQSSLEVMEGTVEQCQRRLRSRR
jgi:hypothetical protein